MCVRVCASEIERKREGRENENGREKWSTAKRVLVSLNKREMQLYIHQCAILQLDCHLQKKKTWSKGIVLYIEKKKVL